VVELEAVVATAAVVPPLASTSCLELDSQKHRPLAQIRSDVVKLDVEYESVPSFRSRYKNPTRNIELRLLVTGRLDLCA
jgi:hypothetical protein